MVLNLIDGKRVIRHRTVHLKRSFPLSKIITNYCGCANHDSLTLTSVNVHSTQMGSDIPQTAPSLKAIFNHTAFTSGNEILQFL